MLYGSRQQTEKEKSPPCGGQWSVLFTQPQHHGQDDSGGIQSASPAGRSGARSHQLFLRKGADGFHVGAGQPHQVFAGQRFQGSQAVALGCQDLLKQVAHTTGVAK